MPLYEFRCADCRQLMAQQRSFAAMNNPGPQCASCGGPTERQFSLTSNIFIPISARAVNKGGAEGGYSWSDFHDVTEKELAKDPMVVPYNEAMSQPDRDGSMRRKKEARRLIEASYADAKAEYAATGVVTSGN